MSSFEMPETLWLDLVPYSEALFLQTKIHSDVCKQGPGLILGLHHPTVVTLGIRGDEEADLVLPEGDFLPIHHVDRGGQATLHSPGQLVIYPILPFGRWGIPPREFTSLLLNSTADLFRDLGLDATAREDRAGVYTPSGKIAFCGLRLQKGVSRHGLALNISNDLRLFSRIRPCGQSQESLTSLSLEDHVKQGELPLLFERWVRIFQRNTRRVIACSPTSHRAL